MKFEHTTIRATDGFELAATVFEPDGGQSATPLVIINSAMGVKRRYYEKFASFLAEQGCTAITYDYRGIGDSRPRHLRGFSARLTEWGEKDFTGVLAWALGRKHFSRISLVGHSVGGQIVGLSPHNEHLAALVFVAAQSGDWRTWDGMGQMRMWLLWHAMIPGLCGVYGYLPGWSGIGEDVPKGVALEWATWGRRPHYILGGADLAARKPGFDRVRTSLTAFSFADDNYAPRRAVEALLGFYAQAGISHHHVRPGENGLPNVGHFGFFREKFKDSLWQQTLTALQI
ncbi:MAG: alpha/beta fold hydrolase [Blastocatellia bacterium]|nr:alpha/beta fold hydrolase [Blastocatellia bacterium]